jgi:hypothetical protein
MLSDVDPEEIGKRLGNDAAAEFRHFFSMKE